LEEPNVNRPFYAFGALLAALALAMLAVSSTSRSTSVSREAVQIKSAAPAAASSVQPARAVRFGLLMVAAGRRRVPDHGGECLLPYVGRLDLLHRLRVGRPTGVRPEMLARQRGMIAAPTATAHDRPLV
jgi:hypothetical protein